MVKYFCWNVNVYIFFCRFLTMPQRRAPGDEKTVYSVGDVNVFIAPSALAGGRPAGHAGERKGGMTRPVGMPGLLRKK